MTLEPEDLAAAARILERTSAFYLIDTETSTGSRIDCCSSRSMPTASIVKGRSRIYMDRRFFQLASHATLAMVNHDESFQFGPKSSHGTFHLEAVLWCAIAERALNPSARDVELALGILNAPSAIVYHYLPYLSPFVSSVYEYEQFDRTMITLFHYFAESHEVAHFELKIGTQPSDEMLENFAAASKLIDRKWAQHQAGGDVSPRIAELFAAAVEVRKSKVLMEEVLADAMALDACQRPFHDPPYLPAKSALTWQLARASLYGLTALRLLMLTDALRSRDREHFDRRWEEIRRLFNARAIYLETLLTMMIIRVPEPEDATPEDNHDAQFQRLSELNQRLRAITRQAEAQLHEWFCEGRMDDFRAEGAQCRADYGLNEEGALLLCGQRLGWLPDE